MRRTNIGRGRQRMAVSFSELLDAFTFVGAGAMHEHEAFLCKQSGQIYWHSELGGDFDELPEDIDDAGKYIQIPDKRELRLGKALALEFTEQRLPRRSSAAAARRLEQWALVARTPPRRLRRRPAPFGEG
jgi:hypothetical protein